MAGLNKYDDKLKREQRRKFREEKEKRRTPRGFIPGKCVHDPDYIYLTEEEDEDNEDDE